MTRYFIKRISLAIISLFILITIVFLLIASFAKNPFATGSPENADALAQANGLKDPILVQYGRYLANFFTGNFGKVYVPSGEYNNIPELFFVPLKWTLLITAPSLIISIIIGVSLGTLAGYNRGKWIDTVVNLFVVFFIGLPSFVIAPIMILIAENSNGTILSEFMRPDEYGWLVTLKSIALPITTVTLGSLAGYTILVRNQIVTVLTSNHVLIAKSKGLTQWEIFWKHIIRNISIPLISFIIPSFTILLAGNIVIEQFFRVPGTSTVVVQAFPNGETNVVMFSLFFFGSIAMLGQIILDLSYIFIDPKIKYFEQGKTSFIKSARNYFARKKACQKPEVVLASTTEATLENQEVASIETTSEHLEGGEQNE